MTRPYLLPYKSWLPSLGTGAELADDAAVIGRADLGRRVALGACATLRADGERIDVGDDCRFLDRATVHIADGLRASKIGRNVTVGRYALVHACTVGEDCVLADGAVVMDGSTVGAGAVIAAGSLVPPRKTLEGGVLYAGNPAIRVRPVAAGEREEIRAAVIAGRGGDEILACDLPPLTMAPFRAGGTGEGTALALDGRAPAVDPRAYVAPNAVVAGDVSIAPKASIWFATALRAEGAAIRIGARSNVQDNSILLASRAAGPIEIGTDVTVGHNVRLGACRIGDGCLIGMGAEVADGVVVEDGAMVGARAFVEPGTVVEKDQIWAGRPARAFRPVKAEERRFFALGKTVYVGYAATYLAAAR